MIIIKDTMTNGNTNIDTLETWEEALDLFETASQSPTIIACTIRDLETNRYKTAAFPRPGIQNALRNHSIDAIHNRPVNQDHS